MIQVLVNQGSELLTSPGTVGLVEFNSVERRMFQAQSIVQIGPARGNRFK